MDQAHAPPERAREKRLHGELTQHARPLAFALLATAARLLHLRSYLPRSQFWLGCFYATAVTMLFMVLVTYFTGLKAKRGLEVRGRRCTNGRPKDMRPFLKPFLPAWQHRSSKRRASSDC